MFDVPNAERYRITGRVQGTDECPYFEFQSEIYWVLVPEDLEMIKQAAKDFVKFFGLEKWDIQINKTRDTWETVRFDD